MTPAPGQRATARGALPVRAVQIVLAFGFLVAWWLTLAPTSLGGLATYVVIRGDSMLPSLEGGDLVIVRSAGRYSVGDVVAYRVPAGELGEGQIVIHRIAGADASAFVVQGDNNPAPDPWQVRPPDIAGTAWLRIPAVGRVLATLHQPAVAGSFAAALVAGGLVLRWLRPAGRDRRDDALGAGGRPVVLASGVSRSA